MAAASGPAGCVEWTQEWGCEPRVRRLLVQAVAVELAGLRAAVWRSGLRRVSVFEPFATRVVVLTRRQTPEQLVDIGWEADLTGTGLWIARPGGDVVVIVAPAPYVQRYVKPAGWAFTERAYTAWVRTTAAAGGTGETGGTGAGGFCGERGVPDRYRLASGPTR